MEFEEKFGHYPAVDSSSLMSPDEMTIPRTELTKGRGDRFIFVGGSPRSGTTLVQNMLDSHPDIFGGPEFLHLTDIIEIRKKLHYSIEKGWIDQFCSGDKVDQLLSAFIEHLLLPVVNKNDYRFLSEKTPSNVLIFSELMDLFPAARFIHVLRDPRAIIASMLQVGVRGRKKGWKTQDFTRSVSAAIKHVKRCFRAGFAAAEIAPEKLLTVVYERLVADPENETKRMCRFLGVEWSSQMMNPGNVKHPGEEAISNEVWYDKKMYTRDPDKSRIDKWKTHLTPLQQITIAKAFRDFYGLSEIGYEFSIEEYSSVERFFGSAISSVSKVPIIVRLGRRFRKIIS